MENVDELNAVFSERFTAAVDEWISLKRKTDGSKYSKLDLASLLHTHCGYSKSCLYRWIEGNGMPTLPNLLCTAKFFNKDLSFFIDKDWSITRVRELINGEAQFKFDTRLLGLGKTGELRFWAPKGDVAEMGVKGGDRVIIEIVKKFVGDGFYILEGFSGSKSEVRLISKHSRGKVEVESIGSKSTKSDREVVLLKNLSILGMVVYKLQAI